MKKSDLSSHLLHGLRLVAAHKQDKISLGGQAAGVEGAPPKSELIAHTQVLLGRLALLQDALHANGNHALLLILQGRDASGKDGTIKTVCGAFNPIGVNVTAFGPPSAEELKHDFLWRVHRATPALGMVSVFNRSHYEDVLVVRVRQLQSRSVWEARYEQINAFEKLLASSGVIVRKCFLHVSREEQHKRLAERLSNPRKNWKFRLGDLEDRALWDDYTDAYRDALTQCSTKAAPWFVVPSDNKEVRNYLVARMLVETLESLDLTYPSIDPAVAAEAEGFE